MDISGVFMCIVKIPHRYELCDLKKKDCHGNSTVQQSNCFVHMLGYEKELGLQVKRKKKVLMKIYIN